MDRCWKGPGGSTKQYSEWSEKSEEEIVPLLFYRQESLPPGNTLCNRTNLNLYSNVPTVRLRQRQTSPRTDPRTEYDPVPYVSTVNETPTKSGEPTTDLSCPDTQRTSWVERTPVLFSEKTPDSFTVFPDKAQDSWSKD